MILMRRYPSRTLLRLLGAVRGVPSSSNLDSISHFAEQNLETGGKAAEHTAASSDGGQTLVSIRSLLSCYASY